MSDVTISTIGGLAAFLFWGTSDWLAARSSKQFSTYDVNLALRPPGLILGIILLAANYGAIGSLGKISPIILVGLLFSTAYIFMIKALSTGSVGVVVPIISINPLITVVLALIFHGRVLSWSQLFSILAIMFGVLLLAYQKNPKKIPLKTLHKETFLAFMAALSWGIGFFVLDDKVKGIAWPVSLAVLSITMFVMASIFVAIKARDTFAMKLKLLAQNKSGLLSGTLLTLGSFAFFYTAAKISSNLLILIVISAAAPLVASFLSAVYDHERLGILKRLGTVLVVAGIILLNTL